MAKKMTLPKIGVNMTEAVIAKWLVAPGDVVKDGDAIIEAETDKSTQEIYATENGVVAELLVNEGDTVALYDDIMVLVDEGEEYEAGSAKAAAPVAPAPAPPIVQLAPAAKPTPAAPVIVPVSAPPGESAVMMFAPATNTERVRISPLAKKTAIDNGIDYRLVSPAEPGARVVKSDVMQYLQGGGPVAQVQIGAGDEVIALTPMRKAIATRMMQSNLEKPCAALTTTVDASALISLRAKCKENGLRISFDALIAKVAAKALRLHPYINAVMEGTTLIQKGDVNIGIAVDTPKGLVVPVIRQADKKSLAETSEELYSMAESAQQGGLDADAMQGSTFTITNLGAFGVEQFTPVINPPECCILAVGAIKQVFVPDENGAPKLASTFQMTLVFDHRMVDGAPAARFLRDCSEFARMPELLL